MERRLSLEQRTERLVQRRCSPRAPRGPPTNPATPSQALLRPRSRGLERAKPLLGSAPSGSILDDPLVRWRLRRCRGEEPALDAPLVGRALLDSDASQGGLQGVPRRMSHDPLGAPQGARPWESRDPPEPIRSHFCNPLQQGKSSPQHGSQEPLRQEPCWGSHDSHEALWPRTSSSLESLQGALYSQSRDSPEALWPISSSHRAFLRQGAPPCGKRDSREPLQQQPWWEPHDCLGALWCAPYWKSRDSQDALQPAREVFPEPLQQGALGSRSRAPPKAPQPIRCSPRDALQGALSQQSLGPLEDSLLWMLRCHRRAIRGRLRAIETLLEPPPVRHQPTAGPEKQ